MPPGTPGSFCSSPVLPSPAGCLPLVFLVASWIQGGPKYLSITVSAELNHMTTTMAINSKSKKTPQVWCSDSHCIAVKMGSLELQGSLQAMTYSKHSLLSLCSKDSFIFPSSTVSGFSPYHDTLPNFLLHCDFGQNIRPSKPYLSLCYTLSTCLI